MSQQPYDDSDKNFSVKSVLTVGPKHCLWFAWSDMTTPGPYGEGAESIPNSDAVQASFVDVEVLSVNPLWRHGPNADQESDPDGKVLAATESLKDKRYCSATYNSQNISSVDTHLNKLVVMFGIDGVPPTAQNPALQIPVGKSARNIPVPAGNPTHIFLGFHDSFEWSNNRGDLISVQLTWHN